MWLQSELTRLQALYSDLVETDIESVLNSGDLESIQDLSSTESSAIRDYLFIPKVSPYNKTDIYFLA